MVLVVYRSQHAGRSHRPIDVFARKQYLLRHYRNPPAHAKDKANSDSHYILNTHHKFLSKLSPETSSRFGSGDIDPRQPVWV